MEKVWSAIRNTVEVNSLPAQDLKTEMKVALAYCEAMKGQCCEWVSLGRGSQIQCVGLVGKNVAVGEPHSFL